MSVPKIRARLRASAEVSNPHRMHGRLRQPVADAEDADAIADADHRPLFGEDGKLTVSDQYMIPGLNVAVIPDFLRLYGLGGDTIWSDILELETYSDDDVLVPNDGWQPKLLLGSHPALNYRGKPVARSKVWLQKDYDRGMLRYGYTGWQWRVSLAQMRMESVPSVDTVTDSLNKLMPDNFQINHAIVTVYRDCNDNIGLHSDKDKDFNSGTGFIVLKLGESRRFQFSDLDGKILYDKRLESGTAVLVGGDANRETKHGVPRDSACSGVSGSIVWRSIGTRVPWKTVYSKGSYK